MSDPVTPTTPTPPVEPTPAPAGNTPEARTETGELKSAASTTPSTEPEKKPEAKPEAKAETKEGDKAPEGAPEAYADFTAPQGFQLNKDAIAKALPVFKELNLTQDAAQKLVNLYAEQSGPAGNQADYEAVRTGWRNEVLKDTSLSTGTDLKPAVKEAIGRTVQALGPELSNEFRQVMNVTGVGDNPAFVRALFKLSEFVTEGRPTSGRGPSPHGQKAPDAGPTSTAKAMYPNLP